MIYNISKRQSDFVISCADLDFSRFFPEGSSFDKGFFFLFFFFFFRLMREGRIQIPHVNGVSLAC